MKLLILASLLAVSFAMQCKDCEQYCNCIKEQEENLPKPTHDPVEVQKALDECQKKAEGSGALKSVNAITSFFQCRNAHCSCAKPISAAVGMALGTQKALAGEGSRRKRQATAKASGNKLLKCVAQQLNCDLSTLSKLLGEYEKREELYLMCFEQKCQIPDSTMIEEEVKCSRRAGFEVTEDKEKEKKKEQ